MVIPDLQPPPGGWWKDWRTSKAKEILSNYIKTGVAPPGIAPMQAYELHPLFRNYNPENFVDNFRRLKEKINKDHERSVFDCAAVCHDRQLFPVQEFDQMGRPRWNGSPAEALVKEIFNTNEDMKKYCDGKEKMSTDERVALFGEHPAAFGPFGFSRWNKQLSNFLVGNKNRIVKKQVMEKKEAKKARKKKN